MAEKNGHRDTTFGTYQTAVQLCTIEPQNTFELMLKRSFYIHDTSADLWLTKKPNFWPWKVRDVSRKMCRQTLERIYRRASFQTKTV